MRHALIGCALMMAGDAGAASLTPVPCPFDDTDLALHDATCARFTRQDPSGTSIGLDIATLTPAYGESAGHVLYIPGGPGEAPVSEDGLFADILSAFRDRTVILFNPRGTAGTAPRLACDFGKNIWREDFGGEDTQRILQGCIDRIAEEGPDPMLFTSRAIAEDIDVLVGALGVERLGLYGISYGTEAALHLLAQSPPWLDFVILDSVSVPGLSGITEEIESRDRFLNALDDWCFADENCSAYARSGAATLADWAGQFDLEPLTVHPHDSFTWTLDGTDMLDFLARLSAYPDGLTIATAAVGLSATNRLQVMGWIKADAEADTDFMRDNIPLMLQAYGDTFDPADFDTVQRPTHYPRDIEDATDQLALYRLWRQDQPPEVRFLDGTRTPAAVSTLVLSGGLDLFTPAEWAVALHTRFAGLEHYLYPLLGHAVSVDTGSAGVGVEMERQLDCAGSAIRAFLNPATATDKRCDAYRMKGTQ